MRMAEKYLSFRAKFFLSSFLATIILPLLGGWALYHQDVTSTRKLICLNLINQTSNLSRLIYPALAFDDNESAYGQIKGLSTDPMLESVVIWKVNSDQPNDLFLFSNYPADKNQDLILKNIIPEDILIGDQITIFRSIDQGQERLGMISVTRSLNDLNQKMAEYLQVGILTVIIIFIIIILITFWYQSSLTKPLKELTTVAKKISLEKDYTIRASKISFDEFGSLTDTFNEMLSSLQFSNSQLRLANEEMEQRVERRTKELTLSNQRIIKEMHEKETATQELIRTRDQLNHNQKLANVGQVSASIAHELRNPMAAIRNSTYYLRLKLDKDRKLLEHLELIDKEISRSDDVIKGLLEITKDGVLKKTYTDAEELAIEAMSYADVSNTSELKIKFAPHHFMIMVDKLLFRQILFNIFHNSIQAMPNGGLIEMILEKTANGIIKISISDEGEGIKPNIINKIFNPLYTDKKEGIGLGLSLCKDLISRHSGTIYAFSTFGKGTTIEIKLPDTLPSKNLNEEE